LPPSNSEGKLGSETNKPDEPVAESADFMVVLEDGVRAVLKNKKASPSERIAAVTAGAKLLMIKHKISGSDEKGFFE
jgi:hypothetical protein